MLSALLLIAISSPSPMLTVEDAVELALAHDAHLEALGARVAEESAVGGWGTEFENPEVRVTSMRSDRLLAPLLGQGSLGTPLQGTSFSLRVPTPKLSSFSSEQARIRERVARRMAEQEIGQLTLAFQVRSLHARARAGQAATRLAKKSLAVAERRATLVQARLREGLVTMVEAEIAQLSVDDELTRFLAQQARADGLRSQLGDLIGRSLESLVLVAPASAPCAKVPSPAPRPDAGEGTSAEWLDVETTPEVRVLRAQAAEASAEEWTGWLDVMPWPNFVQVRYAVGATRVQDDVRLAVSFELPFSDLGQGTIRRARTRADRFRAETRAAAQRQAILRRASLLRADLARRALERISASSPRLAETRKRLVTARAAQSVAPLQLLQLEGRLLAHERRQLEAEEACELAAFALVRLGVSLDRLSRAAVARVP